MRKSSRAAIICMALALSACATANPQAPNLRGTAVEPLNPSKWDYADAVKTRQEALANLPAKTK